MIDFISQPFILLPLETLRRRAGRCFREAAQFFPYVTVVHQPQSNRSWPSFIDLLCTSPTLYYFILLPPLQKTLLYSYVYTLAKRSWKTSILKNISVTHCVITLSMVPQSITSCFGPKIDFILHSRVVGRRAQVCHLNASFPTDARHHQRPAPRLLAVSSRLFAVLRLLPPSSANVVLHCLFLL
jgi:hypothetical protein